MSESTHLGPYHLMTLCLFWRSQASATASLAAMSSSGAVTKTSVYSRIFLYRETTTLNVGHVDGFVMSTVRDLPFAIVFLLLL